MPVSITVRNVPDETRNELAARAARSGRSLQEYLRAQLIELADKPDMATWLARARERVEREGTHLSREQILRDRDADRR
jgi:plasmid stability protein